MDATLVIRLQDENAEPAELETAAMVLRTDLLALDIVAVRGVHEGAVPSDTRAVGTAAVIGAMALTLRSSAALVKQVLDAVKWWAQGDTTGRNAEIVMGNHTLRMTGVTSEQQDRLIELFVEAVSNGTSS